MPLPHRLTAAEQIAAHLRDELARGTWSGTIPGQIRLADELGVARNTVEAALRQLEHEGLLENLGPGRRRRIIMPAGSEALRGLRVCILNMEVAKGVDYMIDLRHSLQEAGHIPFDAEKTMLDMGMDVNRVARFVDRNPADAWVLTAGSLEILEWFSQQATPAFALFGRRAGLPIAACGPNKPQAMSSATRHLIELGHRRIALVVKSMRRKPEPGRSEQAFLDELITHGIPTGEFNLPDWEESRGGFHALLESLFRVTPPTALILDEASLFVATQQHLAKQGIRVPEDVSLICTDADPAFAWCDPSIAHINWDYRPIVRRIVRWAATVSRGGRDLRQSFVRADYVKGGTVGPLPTESGLQSRV